MEIRKRLLQSLFFIIFFTLIVIIITSLPNPSMHPNIYIIIKNMSISSLNLYTKQFSKLVEVGAPLLFSKSYKVGFIILYLNSSYCSIP